MSYKIISVGGSIIIPKTGFDIEFLKRFKNLIIELVRKGEKFILVVGGGATCRQYQKALSESHEVSQADLDWLGIFSTRFNAEFVRLLFGKLAHGQVVESPTNKLIANKPIIIASGWKPGRSTDYVAVMLAKIYGAKQIINASNVDFIYEADPKINKDARPIKQMCWKKFRKIIGNTWTPGANLPFDPRAAQLAAKLGLRLIFIRGSNLIEFRKALSGFNIKGTIITR